MSKVKIIDKKSEKSVLFERQLLSRIRNPFIVNLIYSFQDYENLYLVMDFLKGGVLRYHICKNRNITEDQTRFFLSCLILGLEFIHSHSLIHRDIKPENLLMDSKGYIRITDFGISSVYNKNKKNAYDTSGTPGYMAPEVITGNNHCKVVDYFAMGIIGFELMMGERPYKGKSRKEIKEQMIMYQVEIKEEDIPIGWSIEAANFFNKLLIREPQNRLGFNGINDIKNDEWFSGINFKELYRKKLKSPYKPISDENFDRKYCNYEEKNSLMTLERYKEIMNSNIYAKIFINYTYYPLADINNEKNKINTNNNKKIIKISGKNSKKASPDRNIKSNLIKNNKYLLKEIFHTRHFSNDIGITSDINSFIPLSNRKQEIKFNRINKKFLQNFRLTNNNSDYYLKQYLNYSKTKRKKKFLHLTNINEKNSRSVSFNNKTIDNKSLEKSKRNNINNNNEKKIRKEKTIKPIMRKIKLKLAKNIIKKHIKSNNLINPGKINTIINIDSNNNNTNVNNNGGNYYKLINNKNVEFKKSFFKKINSPKTIKSPTSILGINYIYSAKKPYKKTILNQFNLSNLCNLNFCNNKNIVTLNINNNTTTNNNINTNTNTNNNFINSPNNNVHYHKINNTNTLTKLKSQKKQSNQKKNINNKQKQRNKLENIIQNIYTNMYIKSPLNSPTNKRISIPLVNNLSQVIPQDICNKIIKKNTNYKNSRQQPNKLVKNTQKSDSKTNNKIKKINLSSIQNLDSGNYLTKKNSRNKILQLSKNNNINNNNANSKINKQKKSFKDKKIEFKLSIPSFPQSSMYNQFLTNQTINITLSNCFNNSTINEKKDKIEGVKPIHRRYASINYPISNNTINNNINNINFSSRLKNSNSKRKKKIRLHWVNNNINAI